MLKLTADNETIDITDAALVSDGDPDTTYVVRMLTRHQQSELIKKHTTKRPNKATRQMESVTDWEAVGEDQLDAALVGWQGVMWEGQPAPCTKELKLRLDILRAKALLDLAGVNQVQAVAEQRAESFRAPA